MRWDCGARARARYARLTDWHRWFAWRPVHVEGIGCVWLEWIERRGDFWQGGAGDSGWDWNYRATLQHRDTGC